MKNETKILGVPPTWVPIHPIIDALPAYGLRKIFEVYFFLQILLGQGLTAGAVKE